MIESINNGMDANGLILLIGILVIAVLVLLRNRPFVFIGRLFRAVVGRPLGKFFRPLTSVLKGLRIMPRAATKEGRNYVGPAAFSSLIRAFRPKTEVELELDKTEFMAEIARKAIEKAKAERTSAGLEGAAKTFHDSYNAATNLLNRAFEEADGDPAAVKENFRRLQEDPPHGYAKPGIFVDPDEVRSALEHEEAHLNRRGLIFKWLEPDGHFIREEDIEWDQAEKNYFLANIFFTYDLPVGTPQRVKPTSLYEEIDGAFNVSMFGIKDRDVYHLLTQMRKVINGNVRRLTVWFSLITAAFFLFNVYIAGGVPESPLRSFLDLDTPFAFSGIELSGETKVLALSFLASVIAMWLLYTAEYRHYVRNNGREMNNFLTRYLARLNNFYRQAERNARGVFAGEVDVAAAEMQEHAQVWFANIQWIAFRAFYIETFLRNTLYQVYRNSGYYIFLVPFLFVLATYLLLAYTGYLSTVAGMFKWGAPSDPEVLHSLLFSVGLLAIVAIVAYYLTHSLSDLEGTIREQEWFNFHHFALQRTTTNLIGRYGGEIKFWRERLKSSEGRTG